MAATNTVFTGSEGALWLQPGGAGNDVEFLGCYELGDLTEPLGDVTQRLCPSDGEPNTWRIQMRMRQPADRVTSSITVPLGPTRDWLEKLDCPAPLYIHQRKCGRADDWDNYVRGQVLQDAIITSVTQSNLRLREANDESSVVYEISGNLLERYYKCIVMALTTTETQTLNDIVFGNTAACWGECGPAQAICDEGYIVCQAAGGAPANVLYTANGGVGWAATATDPFGNDDNILSVTMFRIDNDTLRVLVIRDDDSGGGGALDVAYSDDLGVTWNNVVVGAAADTAIWNGALFARNERHVWAGYSDDLTTATAKPTEANDDCDTDSGAGGSINLVGVNLVFGTDAAGDNLHTGVRFRNVAVPQYATVTGAFIRLNAVNALANVIMRARIYGEDVGAPAIFGTYANFIGRVRTDHYVDWHDIPLWAAATLYDTPDISLIVQEIVNRGDWATGQDMVMFIQNDETSPSDVNATRDFESWDAGGVLEAEIHITYADEGYISKSDDGALTWAPQQTTEPITYIRFCDEDTGIAVGGISTILLTEDSGTTWMASTTTPADVANSNKTGITITCCDIISRNVLWVGYEDGELWYSLDGGVTWHQRSFNLPSDCAHLDFTINDLMFYDAFHGAFVFDYKGLLSVVSEAIYITSNGGRNWEMYESDSTAFAWNACWVCDYDTAFAVGDATGALGQIDLIEPSP